MAIFREYRAGGRRNSSGSSSMSSGEIVEERDAAAATEEKVFVAVGKSFKQTKSKLIWASKRFRGKPICILHVHQPAHMIPLLGAHFPASNLKDQEVKAFREIEQQDMHKLLDEYLLLCQQIGVVWAEKMPVTSDCVETGILELITLHGIKKLVMGAADDKRYSRDMTELKSKKARAVRNQAPIACDLWFICKGHLVDSREANAGTTPSDVGTSSPQPNLNAEPGSSSQQGLSDSRTGSVVQRLDLRKTQSISLGHSNYVAPTNPVINLFRRAKSAHIDTNRGTARIPTTLEDSHTLASQGLSDAEVSLDECLSRASTSQSSALSTCSSTGTPSFGQTQLTNARGSEDESDLSILTRSKDDFLHSSPSTLLVGSSDDPLYNQLEQAMSEAKKSRLELFEEANRRDRAEKDALDAIRKARHFEGLHNEEFRQRRQIEEALAKEKEEFEMMRSQRDKVMEELALAQNQISILNKQIAESNNTARALEEKVVTSVKLMQAYKTQRDEWKQVHDIALQEIEQLQRSQMGASASGSPLSYLEFSLAEIEEATHNFDQSYEIGKGGYGSIYKGVLHHTMVAVKRLDPQSKQGPREYRQEVDVLSKIRHPNLVTLIGVCPETCSLIYEHAPNGSLEDRLSRRDNSPPLSWQSRIRIATELCSVLIFLHSSKPYRIIHGDLKPANVLLDAHFVSKLSDFGTSRLLHRDDGESSNMCYLTNPKGTPGYMDPDFINTGELTMKSDVFAYGVILLRLLTGRPAIGLVKEVQSALENRNLGSLIDLSAGAWPFVQAEQLAHLALSCCDGDREGRPDLSGGVLRILEPMMASIGESPSIRLGSEEERRPPPHFVCPIFHEIMCDPHMAADGYTYEAEALRGWLDCGHDTSPMTNAKLAHCNLVANHALRSAILEWRQQQ